MTVSAPVSISQNASIADNYSFRESMTDSYKDVLFESYPCHGLIVAQCNRQETLSESSDQSEEAGTRYDRSRNSYIPAW